MPPYVIAARSPLPDAVDVAPTEDVFFAFTLNLGSTLTSSTTYLDDVLAAKNEVPARPDFSGLSTVLVRYHALLLHPRRSRNAGALVTFRMDLVIDALPFSETWSWHAAQRPPALRDPSLRHTRLDAAFTTLHTLEVLRLRLRDALVPRPSGSYLVQAFHAVKVSTLRPVLHAIPAFAALDREAARLVAEDLGDLNAAVLVARGLAPLWDAVLGELAALGVAPLDLTSLDAAYRSDAPTEVVAAACAALVLAASYASAVG